MHVVRRTLVLAMTLGVVACASSGSSNQDEQPVLDALTTNVIVPSFRELDAKAASLAAAVRDFSLDRTEAKLAAAQSAWRETRVAFRHTDAFRFGPSESKHLTPHIDFFPASADAVETLLASTTELNSAAIEALGSNARGLLALEYLLFDTTGSNAAILARFADATSGARRASFAALLAENVNLKTTAIAQAWAPEGENFAREVTAAGSGSSTFPSKKSAIDQLMNQMAFAVEEALVDQIAEPLGKKNGGVPEPEELRTPYSDDSIAEIAAILDSSRSVYTGAFGTGTGTGLSLLVKAKNSALDGRVLSAFASASSTCASIPPPLRTAVTLHPAEMEAAYETTRTLKSTLTTEVASLLGTTLQFNDNDGD